jgi:hypothetical protein
MKTTELKTTENMMPASVSSGDLLDSVILTLHTYDKTF